MAPLLHAIGLVSTFPAGPVPYLAHSQASRIRALHASSATEILNAPGNWTAFRHAGFPQAKAHRKRTLI